MLSVVNIGKTERQSEIGKNIIISPLLQSTFSKRKKTNFISIHLWELRENIENGRCSTKQGPRSGAFHTHFIQLLLSTEMTKIRKFNCFANGPMGVLNVHVTNSNGVGFRLPGTLCQCGVKKQLHRACCYYLNEFSPVKPQTQRKPLSFSLDPNWSYNG